MLTAALFTISKGGSSSSVLKMTDERINEMWSVFSMNCDPTLTRKDILTHATIGVNLEGIRLSEVSR